MFAEDLVSKSDGQARKRDFWAWVSISRNSRDIAEVGTTGGKGVTNAIW